MMVDKKGYKCRNIQEQVGKNTCDIKELKERTPVTDFVINATKSEDETTLHVKQRVDSEVQEFDFKGGKKVVAGINIGVQETADSYIISASTEPVGSVNWGAIGGDIAYQEDLANILNNKFTLNFTGQGGNETNGWFRTTHQSGVQVKSLLTNTAAWLLSDRIRYYPTSSSSPYYDFYFPEESGDLMLAFTTSRDLELNNHVLSLSLQFTDRINEIEDNIEYLGQVKQDHDSLEKDVSALGFLKGSDRFINSLKVENHTLKWTYDDGVTGSTFIPYIEANPSGQATDILTKLSVNGTIYSIDSGGEPDAYIKGASVSGNTLTLTKQDDSTISFTPSGSGGITDVLVNESSVVTEGVAHINIPADAQLVYDMTLNTETGSVTINNPNYYQRILDYIDENDKYPVLYGVVHIASQPDVIVNIKQIIQTSSALTMTGIFENVIGELVEQDKIEIVATSSSQLATYTVNNVASQAYVDNHHDASKLNVKDLDSSVEALGYAKGTIPTLTSQLTNDSGFITASVSNLTNYYDKTAIEEMIGDVEELLSEI